MKSFFWAGFEKRADDMMGRRAMSKMFGSKDAAPPPPPPPPPPAPSLGQEINGAANRAVHGG